MRMKKRVLIIDDSGYSRATIRSVLEEAGYIVVGEAKNGTEALHMIKSIEHDLMTLDNILPDMTGLDILRKLKQSDHELQSKVLMISAVGQQSAIQEGLELGAVAYITKPFTSEQLIGHVRDTLER